MSQNTGFCLKLALLTPLALIWHLVVQKNAGAWTHAGASIGDWQMGRFDRVLVVDFGGDRLGRSSYLPTPSHTLEQDFQAAISLPFFTDLGGAP